MSQPNGEPGDPSAEPRDPFRTDGSPPPRPEGPPRSPGGGDDRQPPSPEARRKAIRLAVVSIAAVGGAFFAPPLGAVLGVVAIVLAVRATHVVPARPRVLAIVSGSIAVVVGVVISAAALIFRAELVEYNRCRQAANTVQAEQNCQDALNEALASRLGL